MDRNEVVLVGRLSSAAEDKTLPSGDTLTKWRLVVRRRRRHRRGGTLTDSIPCVTFDPEAASLVRSLKPPALLEVMGAFRCRIYGPARAKIWRYEVEVLTARPVDAESVALSEPYESAASAGPVGSVGSAGSLGPIGSLGSLGSLGSIGPVGVGPVVAVRPVGSLGSVGRPVGPMGPVSSIDSVRSIGSVGAVGPMDPVGSVGSVGSSGR